MNLFEYKDLIDGKPMHIATVNKSNNPNLAVASDVKVIENDKIIISVNEMVNTQENIQLRSTFIKFLSLKSEIQLETVLGCTPNSSAK